MWQHGKLSVHFSSLWRVGCSVCLFHRVRKSCRQSGWCFEGVFHPPFSCQMHSIVKGSIAFEIFIVVTLVTPLFSNRPVVRRSDEPLIGSADQWNYRQTESSLYLLEGGGIWTFNLSCFKSAWWDIVLLYKTFCTQTAFSGYKKSLLYHGVALAHFVHILKEKKETMLSVIWLFSCIKHDPTHRPASFQWVAKCCRELNRCLDCMVCPLSWSILWTACTT